MHSERLNWLQAALKRENVDCLALLPGADLHYLTGFNFHLMERPTVGLFPSKGSPVFVLPALEMSSYEADAPYQARAFPWADGEGPEAAFREADAPASRGDPGWGWDGLQ